MLVVVLHTELRVGDPLASRPRSHRFPHAGSAEAALEAIETVSENNHWPDRRFTLHRIALLVTAADKKSIRSSVRLFLKQSCAEK